MTENQEVHGTVSFSIKPYGIEWFDKIVQEDNEIKQAVSVLNLSLIDKRLDELELEHGIPTKNKKLV